MRTRQFARVEKIRSKERNLLEVLRRQVAQQTLDLFPASVHPGTPLQYNAPIGGTTVTIYAPLVVIAQSPTRTYVVDTAESPDPTGGFAPVTIPASNVLCEMAADTPVNFAGQPAGEYVVYAAHQIAQENPETRHPPAIHAEGAGVNPTHRDFFGHGEPDNTPIPREAFDPTLTPETVSEWVDRVSVGISTNAGSQHAHLLLVSWNGAIITQVREPANLYADMRVVLTRMAAVENTLGTHVGSRGNAHGLVSTGTGGQPGFMSSADKAKLDSAPANIQGALDAKANAASLSSHIGSRGAAHSVATTSEAGFMSSGDKTKLDGVTGGIGGAGTVSRAMLANGVARSIIGRSASSAGAVADITADTDHHVLRRSGSTIGFGQVATDGIADAAVTNAKIGSMAASKLTGAVAIANGGTGATTAANARTNLGVAAASHSHDAEDISRLTESHLPRAASGFLAARGTSTDPHYRAITAADIEVLFGATGGSSNRVAIDGIRITGTVSRGSLPVGATNTTQVAPGQSMTGMGDARHPVGAVRLVHATVIPGTTVTAPSLMSGVRLATLSATRVNLSAYPSQESITADVISIGSYASSPTLPGSWTIISQVNSPLVGGSAGGAPGLALAVRTS